MKSEVKGTATSKRLGNTVLEFPKILGHYGHLINQTPDKSPISFHAHENQWTEIPYYTILWYSHTEDSYTHYVNQRMHSIKYDTVQIIKYPLPLPTISFL